MGNVPTQYKLNRLVAFLPLSISHVHTAKHFHSSVQVTFVRPWIRRVGPRSRVTASS